jgi:DNA-binding transcriptional LysR family regulator
VLSVYPFATATAAAAAGVGIVEIPCLGADADPRLVRLTGVIHSYDVWLVTSQEARKNRRLATIKDALMEMYRAAATEISGGAP